MNFIEGFVDMVKAIKAIACRHGKKAGLLACMQSPQTAGCIAAWLWKPDIAASDHDMLLIAVLVGPRAEKEGHGTRLRMWLGIR